MAYILTRPLGASLGDYLSQPRANGGLALGPTVTSAVFLAAILAVVGYLSATQRDFIRDPLAPEPATATGRGVVWQVVVVVALLVGVGGTGYKLRKDQLRAQAAAAVRPGRPLGDLSAFKQLAEGMLAKVEAGDLGGASSGADQLETAWDNGQAVMQAMNGAKWTVMDDAIDKVLKRVRSSSSDSGAALKALLAVINSLDQPVGQAGGAAMAPGQTPPAVAVASPAAPPSKPPASVTPGRPLGDLSAFAHVAQDLLDPSVPT